MKTLTLIASLGAASLGFADAPPAPPSIPTVGVIGSPCAGVPVVATAAHQATADPYLNWMHDWLALDWGQKCRYQRENAALPPASNEAKHLVP